MTRSSGNAPIVEAIRSAVAKVLADRPEAPVKVRLLRDALRVEVENDDLLAAISSLDNHPLVERLATEQRADGGWGRFHTVDYTSKQKTRRTEDGVSLAVDLGLPKDHPVLVRAKRYIEGILTGGIPFPDRAEKHENWPTGVSLFAGATLSQFVPESPVLDETFDFWSAVLRRAFRNGTYDMDAELRAHRQLLGRSGSPTWLRLCSKYVVQILASRSHLLSEGIRSAYVSWLWEDCPRGLVYFEIPLSVSPEGLKGFRLGGWMSCMGLIARFPESSTIARPSIERLLSLRRSDGLWDFGVQPSCPRLSSSYRSGRFTAHDWTTLTACVLVRFNEKGA